MLENKYDWKISKADQNGNVYYYFPKDEDEFKRSSCKKWRYECVCLSRR